MSFGSPWRAAGEQTEYVYHRVTKSPTRSHSPPIASDSNAFAPSFGSPQSQRFQPQSFRSPGPQFYSPHYRQAPINSVLYAVDLSCNCLGPWLFLKHARIPFDVKRVDLMKKEQFQPSFLAKNPKHTVPTFEDKNGVTLWESNAILRYIAHSNSLQEYYPIDDVGRAHTELALDWRSSSFYPSWSKIAYPVLGFAKSTEEETAAATASLHEDIQLFVQRFLGTDPFVGGVIPSIADFALFPLIHVLCHPAVPFDVPPEVEEYHRRMQEKVTVSREVFQPLDRLLDSKVPAPSYGSAYQVGSPSRYSAGNSGGYHNSYRPGHSAFQRSTSPPHAAYETEWRLSRYSAS